LVGDPWTTSSHDWPGIKKRQWTDPTPGHARLSATRCLGVVVRAGGQKNFQGRKFRQGLHGLHKTRRAFGSAHVSARRVWEQQLRGGEGQERWSGLRSAPRLRQAKDAQMKAPRLVGVALTHARFKGDG
jgi:hypothetical protein